MCRFIFTFILLLVYFVTCLWKGFSDVEVRSWVSSSLFYCICTMITATTPSVRTPRDDTMGGVSSIYTHSGLWNCPKPQSSLLISFFCWPNSLFSCLSILTISPLAFRWLLSLQPSGLHSRPLEEEEKRA